MYFPALAEPLHQWTQGGLTTLSNPGLAGGGGMVDAQTMLRDAMQNPQAIANKYISPMATDYMGRAGAATSQAMTPVEMAEIEARRNPYAGALRSSLSKTAEEMRARVMSTEGMRGGRSFGDTSTGVQNRGINDSILQGNMDIDYKTFQDALGQINTERNRYMTGGGQFGNLASAAQGIQESGATQGMRGIGALFDMGQAQTNQALQNARNKIEAGEFVRDFNQRLNDSTMNDWFAEDADPMQKIRDALAAYGEYKTSSSGTNPVSSLEQIGGAGQYLGGMMSGGAFDDLFG
jgi:hypothetical protein